VFGGTNVFEAEDNIVSYDDFYVFDVETKIWEEIKNKSGSFIEARDSFSMVSLNGYIFVFGGIGKSEAHFNDFFQILVKITRTITNILFFKSFFFVLNIVKD
jgi:N-acetylneuraminic acid mutarotase